jgi:release factor glutamine methyltransferase
MRPSEYTAALLRVIEQRAGSRTIRQAIEIGMGSGVLLAVLARNGAQELWGVDIDPEALVAARTLLAPEAADKPIHLLLGDVWRDVPPLKFDVIIANLPHFPAILPPSPGRNPSWSGGGRRVMDEFLRGLAAHLAIDGVAWMTHHGLAGLDRSAAILNARGLTMDKVFSWTVYESEERIAAVPAAIIAKGERASLRRFGNYYFVDAHVVEIRRARAVSDSFLQPVNQPGCEVNP